MGLPNLKEIALGVTLGLNNRQPLARMNQSSDDVSGAWLRVADNIDINHDGYVRRRSGFAQAKTGQWRDLWADANDAYAVVDGTLCRVDMTTLDAMPISPAVAISGKVSYARFPDGFVYASDGKSRWRLDGSTLRQWITPAPNPEPTASVSGGGSLQAGQYQVCFTSVGADGESTPTEPIALTVQDGGAINFTGVNPDTVIYATSKDGTVFNEVQAGVYSVESNDGAACPTQGMAEMPAGHSVTHYRGSMLVASGRFLYVSEPYRYGMCDMTRGFVPFPADITVIAPCDDGVFICADKTYWIAGDLFDSSPVVVAQIGALRNSLHMDNEASTAYWQTKNGLAVAGRGGALAFPQDAALQFDDAANGMTWKRQQDGQTHIISQRT